MRAISNLDELVFCVVLSAPHVSELWPMGLL